MVMRWRVQGAEKNTRLGKAGLSMVILTNQHSPLLCWFVLVAMLRIINQVIIAGAPIMQVGHQRKEALSPVRRATVSSLMEESNF